MLPTQPTGQKMHSSISIDPSNLCAICGREFSSKKQLYNHRSREHQGELEIKKKCAQFSCLCGSIFSRADNLKRH